MLGRTVMPIGNCYCRCKVYLNNNNKLLILKNEIKELISIFDNFNELIIIQDHGINTINDNITNAELIVEEGKKELIEADKYNKKIYGAGIIISSGIIGSIISYPITCLFLSSKITTGSMTLIGGLFGLLTSKKLLNEKTKQP